MVRLRVGTRKAVHANPDAPESRAGQGVNLSAGDVGPNREIRGVARANPQNQKDPKRKPRPTVDGQFKQLRPNRGPACYRQHARAPVPNASGGPPVRQELRPQSRPYHLNKVPALRRTPRRTRDTVRHQRRNRHAPGIVWLVCRRPRPVSHALRTGGDCQHQRQASRHIREGRRRKRCKLNRHHPGREVVR